MGFVLGLTAIAACGSTEPLASLEGDYALVSINGGAVPASGPDPFEVTAKSGELQLGPDTWELTVDFLLASDSSACGKGCDREQAAGTWMRERNGRIAFTVAGNAGAFEATFANNQISTLTDGLIMVFTRR
jgi:hypothetical protein